MAAKAKTTQEFLKRQRQSFLKEWQRFGYFWAGVRSLEGFNGRLFGKNSWKNLSSVKAGNAIVAGPNTESPELWVLPAYSGYEGAFAEYALTYYGYDYMAAPEKQTYDVDHLFSHKRAGPA